MYGLNGKPMNYYLAFTSFQRAAAGGNSDAMLMVAKAYLNGQGVLKDELQGLHWLAKACNSKKCPHAKNELATIIITNLKDQNPRCVVDFCESLLLEGQGATGIRNSDSTNGSYGVEDAIKLLLDAASDGCVDAKNSLGAIYEEAGDLEQAETW
jgi:TPR repeat protein